MNRVALIISIFALTAATARAQEFATINPDIRTAGMANASTAVSGGAFSIYGNAAATLFDFERIQLGFACSPWKSGGTAGNYYAAGGYYSINEKHTLEAGMRIYKMPDAGSGRTSDASADLAYALLVHKYAGIAVTAHYMHSSYGNNMSYNALGFDISTYVQIPAEKLDSGAWVALGAKIADVGFAFGHSGNMLPSRASAGAALYSPAGSSHELMGTVELEYRFAPAGFNSIGLGIGAEYTLMQLLSLRAGYHVADDRGADYGTVGAGISFMMLKADFSYLFASRKSPLRNIYGISVSVKF